MTDIVGELAAGLVASPLVNPASSDGLLCDNPMQLPMQTMGIVVAAAFGFGGTVVIMEIVNTVKGLIVTKGKRK